MRMLKGYNENRKFDADSLNFRKIYLFHTHLSPNSITLVIYEYRLYLIHLSIRKATISLFLPRVLTGGLTPQIHNMPIVPKNLQKFLTFGGLLHPN